MGQQGQKRDIAINEKEEENKQIANNYDDDDFVPYYRRNIRHFGSPVKISPVINGIPYIVRVRAVTLSGSKISAFSSAMTPKGPPPIPKINKLLPLESSVKIEFVCNDYATEEYKAKFEIESFPQTVPMKNIKMSPYIFPKLNNGRSYKFHLRGINKEGKSKWSEVSQPVTPLQIPPQPIELRLVPFDREITVFWVCEELKTPEYSGWYEVESDPPTFTMVVTRQQARFRRLDNGRKYIFKVTAVNQVGKTTSEWSTHCIPDDDIKKESYLRKKKAIACDLKEVLLKKRKEHKKKKAHDKLAQLKKTKKDKTKKDKKAEKEAYNKIIAKKQKKRKQHESKKKKEEMERLQKKKKMEEQRKKVMQNKRRMSFLAREKISRMESKFGVRNKGKNTNTALSMMNGKKNKKRKVPTNKPPKVPMPNVEKLKIDKLKKPESIKKGSGTPLLPDNEIKKLTKLRDRDEKKRLSKAATSKTMDNKPRKSKKKRKTKTKKEKMMD